AAPPARRTRLEAALLAGGRARPPAGVPTPARLLRRQAVGAAPPFPSLHRSPRPPAMAPPWTPAAGRSRAAAARAQSRARRSSPEGGARGGRACPDEVRGKPPLSG